MEWDFSQLATVAAALNATLHVPFPTTVNAGDALFLAVVAGPTGLTFVPSDTDFVSASVRTSNLSAQLFWKIANGSETGNCDVTGTNGAIYGHISSFTGGPASVTGNIHA